MFGCIQEDEQDIVHRQCWTVWEVFWLSGLLVGKSIFYKQEDEDNNNIDFRCSGYLCGVLHWASILGFQTTIIQVRAQPDIESGRLDNPIEDLKGITPQSNIRFQPRNLLGVGSYRSVYRGTLP